ncbi:hypothetical protein J4414_02940 [Candidatus Woesearchaeota archaeon]|nr:hypothetical protein [Candidatus Woesearchaeota archaeon]
MKSGIVILENVLDSLGKVTEEYLEKESGRVNSLNLIRKVDNIESRIEIFRAKLTGVEEEPPFNTSSWKNNGLILTEDNSSVLSYLNDNEITERDQLYRWIDKIYKDRQEISLFFPDKENILIGYYLDGDKPKYYFLNRSRVLEYFRKIENEENEDFEMNYIIKTPLVKVEFPVFQITTGNEEKEKKTSNIYLSSDFEEAKKQLSGLLKGSSRLLDAIGKHSDEINSLIEDYAGNLYVKTS